MSFIKKYWLWALILLGCFIRLYCLHFPSFTIDMTDWQAWTAKLDSVGPVHFYAPGYFSDYFPGYLYMLWFMGSIFQLFGNNVASPAYAMYLKTITTLFEFATAYLAYKIVVPTSKKWALFAAAAYLLNPAAIFNSAVWGQADGIFTFFLLLATFILLEKHSLKLFAVWFGIAFLIKPQSVMLVPFYLYYTMRNFGTKAITITFAGSALLVFLLALPFYLHNPFFGPLQTLLSATSTYPYTSLFAYNFWALVGFWIPDSTKWLGISYSLWGYILYAVSLLITGWLIFKQRFTLSIPRYYLLAALLIFFFYLFPTRMHDRYLFPVFIFLLLAACLAQSYFLAMLYGILSLIHFCNLYYVYYYYNVLYNHPTVHPNGLYLFINAQAKPMAVITLGICGSLCFWLWRSHREISHVTNRSAFQKSTI